MKTTFYVSCKTKFIIKLLSFSCHANSTMSSVKSFEHSCVIHLEWTTLPYAPNLDLAEGQQWPLGLELGPIVEVATGQLLLTAPESTSPSLSSTGRRSRAMAA
jgi:hypothetical protein